MESKSEVLPTTGGGDCAIHATLGTYDGSFVTCTDVSVQRNKLSVTMHEATPTSRVYSLMCQGIQEVVQSGTKIGHWTQTLQGQYHEFIASQTKLSSQLWDVFAETMSAHPEIGEFVEENHKLLSSASDYAKLYDALNRSDNMLYGLLMSVSDLFQAFSAFNENSSIDFNWSRKISGNVIKEYVCFVCEPRTWLLSLEIAIIAEAFKLHITYYPAPGANHMTFGLQYSQKVAVQFNKNHFERLIAHDEYVAFVKSSKATTKGLSATAKGLPATAKGLPATAKGLPAKKMSSSIPPTPPLTLDNVFGMLSLSSENNYQVSPLLPAGTRGAVYQLQVFLNLLIELLLKGAQFSAEFESADLGNLDDIVIRIEDTKGSITEVQAYQIKYYDHEIVASDFIEIEKKKPKLDKASDEKVENKSGEKCDNKSDEKAGKKAGKKADKETTKKMNIGKFFDGWLSLRLKYSYLSHNQVRCILYSNAGIDKTIQNCLNGSHFKDSFVNGSEQFYLLRTEKVPKNFLFKQGSISVKKSSAVWALLHNNKIIDDEGYFTQHATTLPKFSINLESHPLATQNIINVCLEEMRLRVQEIFNDVLFRNACSYLQKKKKHVGLKPEQLKIQFREFLKSFEIQVKQPDLYQTNDSIIKNIYASTSDQQRMHSSQIFICLYYALQQWFLDEKKGNHNRITNELLRGFLETAAVQCHSVVVLQTKSNAALKHVSNTCGGKSVQRDELEKLKAELGKSNMIVIVGKKGIGKSGLVKQLLTDGYHEEQYLFLPASELLQKSDWQLVLDVFKNIKKIELIVIDSAEQLAQLAEQELTQFLKDLKNIGRIVIFTLTKEAAHHPLFKGFNRIKVKPLPEQRILSVYPVLEHYRNVTSLITRAQTPFYLSAILQFTNRLSSSGFRDHTKVDIELIRLVIEGKHETQVLSRRQVWQQLAVKIASSKIGLSQFFELTLNLESISSLVADNVLVQKGNEYRFSHDLFFEHGLLAFWFQKWDLSLVDSTLDQFWQQLSKQLEEESTRKVLEKFLLSDQKELQESLIKSAATITSENYVYIIITYALREKNTTLLQSLLSSNSDLALSSVLKHVFDYHDTTYVSLALELDCAEALKLLLQHGALAHHPNSKKRTFVDPFQARRFQTNNSERSETDSDFEANETDSDFEGNEGDDGEEYERASKEDEFDERVIEEEDEDEFDPFSQRSDSSQEEQYRAELSDDRETPLSRFLDCAGKYFLADFRDSSDLENFNYYEEEDIEEDFTYAYAKPNYQDFYIHLAAMRKQIECLRVFVKHKRSLVFEKNEFDETPLHMAVSEQAYECVNLLLAEKASVDSEDAWRETPLHNAAYIDDILLMKALLIHSADPNHQNVVQLSPFHIVLVKQNLEAAKLFLEEGADVRFDPFSGCCRNLAEFLAMCGNKNGTQEHELTRFISSLIKLLNDHSKNRTQLNPSIAELREKFGVDEESDEEGDQRK